jgi:hypothetical protein
MRLALVTVALLHGVAMADEAPPSARLDFKLTHAKVKRVRVDGRPATDWLDDDVLRVPGFGFKRVEVTYENDGGAHRSVMNIGFAPGVAVRLQDHNGAIDMAQPAGRRCGRVEGSDARWVLCDGPDVHIPVATTFDLRCANPVSSGRNHLFWIDDSRHPESPTFVPTLPGLYRARYRRGRISISYEPDDCADARPLGSRTP